MTCSGFLIARANTTTYLENGEWELETSQMKNEGGYLSVNNNYSYCEVKVQHTGKSNSNNASLRPALISVSCLLVVASVLMFIVGFICGHCFSQRTRKFTA